MNKLKIPFLLLLFISLQNYALSAIRYVKAGNPAPMPPYTSWATASDSIQKCINVCVPGDTIYVGVGVYKERVFLKSSLSLIGSGIDSCIIDTRSIILGGTPPMMEFADSCYVTGLCLYVYNGPNLRHGVDFIKYYGTPMEGVFENNKIVNAGVGISLHNTNVIIRNNILFDIVNGISYEAGHPIIINNLITDVENYGISARFSGASEMTGNIIISKKSSHYLLGFNSGFTGENKFANNIVIATRDGNTGIDSYVDTLINNNILGYFQLSCMVQQNVYRNNIISGSKEAFFWIDYFNTYIVKNNDVWDVETISNRGPLDSTNIFKDPMFVNPDSGDYRLQAYSPLIDAGDPGILDLDGSRSDIGAYGGPQGSSYIYKDYPPRVPRGLQVTASGDELTITWVKNTEADFSYYTVYMDTLPGFTPSDGNRLGILAENLLRTNIPPLSKRLYFKITATDSQRNTSLPSEEAYINLTAVKEGELTLQEYNLFHNYPDPFSTYTTIGYTLKEEGYVKLNIYDIRGELVKTLVNEVQGGGYHETVFNPSSGSAENANSPASGIYIYRIDVIGRGNIPVYSMTNKMIRLK